jgi:hypothetical protein
MRTRFALRHTPDLDVLVVVFALTVLTAARAGADDQKKERPKAPADYSILESDMAGSYFIAKPLKEKYDNLLKRVGELRTEIDEARIDESKARREIDQLQGEIDAAIRQIDKEKLYVPGAIVQKRTVTKNVPLGAGDYLFVEAENVEIRGGEGPELKCIVEKTVLGEIGKDEDLTSDFDGIELVVGRSSGKAKFGYYKTAAERPDMKHAYEQFPFKPFLDRDFTLISIKGLTHQEGNRQINISVSSERGEGRSASEWCRHAKLILVVPKCQGVGVRGGLRGFRVQSFDGPLMVEGEGNRDYETRYEVFDLGGPFTASNIPIHRIDGAKGDVSVLATAYSENTDSTYNASGITMRTVAPKGTSYKNLQGCLLARFCRADLSLEGVAGRVDVTNEFGKTVWRADRPIAAMDHRIVSQSGAIEVHFAPDSLGKLRLMLFTECGAIRLPKGANGLQSLMFDGNTGDVTRRSWHGLFSGTPDERHADFSFSLYTRIPAAVLGTRRPQGIDIISRAGIITYEPLAEK